MTAETDMVERVARAICAQRLPCLASAATPDDMVDGLLHGPQPRWKMHIGHARAAIEAMREPTMAMREAGREEVEMIDRRFSQSPIGIWQAMIDSALSEKGKG